LGALVGLLMPAVQRARESGNYIACRNHLRQIGLAIHGYEVSRGYFPGLGGLPHQESVLAQVLPFAELDNLRDRFAADQPLSSTMFVSEALLGSGKNDYEVATDPRRQWMTVSCMTALNADRPGTMVPLTDAFCMSPVGMTWLGDRGASWIGGPGQRSAFNTY